MKLKPIGERVLVMPIEVEQKVGGIIIPDTAKEKPMTGEVLAVSNQSKTGLEEGDRVFYRRYAGIEVETDGVKYLVLNDDDIIAVVED